MIYDKWYRYSVFEVCISGIPACWNVPVYSMIVDLLDLAGYAYV